jgi:MFS family permease
MSIELHPSRRAAREPRPRAVRLLAVAFGADSASAPLAYCAFTACWALGRFVGDRLTSRTGDVFIVRAVGILAAAGVGSGLVGGTPVWVMAGCALTGLGIANVVPLLFRAAARATFDGRGLAIVTGVGYAGFLVSPPLVGFAANAVGLPRAMWLVVVGGLALAMGAAVLRRQTTFNCRAVLLDLDGTLVDSSETVDAVWKAWTASVGVDPTPILAVHHGRRPAETLTLTYPHLATPEALAWVDQAQVGREGVKPISGAAS